MRQAVLLPIDSLRFSIKKRHGVCPKRIEELRREIEFGDTEIMPIRVNALGDGTYCVKDGRHRIQAHLAAGMNYIYAYVDNLCTRLRKIFLDFLSKINLAPAGFFYFERVGGVDLRLFCPPSLTKGLGTPSSKFSAENFDSGVRPPKTLL